MTDEQLQLDLVWEKMEFQNGEKVEFELAALPPNEELPRRAPDSKFIEDLNHNGQEMPILVASTERGYIVVDGNKRVKAARSLGWSHVLAFVRTMSYQQAVIMRARINNIRTHNDMSDILAIEEILQAYPATANVKTISYLTGISIGRVKQLMRQASLNPVLHNAVLDGLITEETLHAISKVPGAEGMALDKLQSEGALYERNGNAWKSLKTGRALTRAPILVTPDDVRDVQRVRVAQEVKKLDLGLKVEQKLQGYAGMNRKGEFLTRLLNSPDEVRQEAAGKFIVVLVREI